MANVVEDVVDEGEESEKDDQVGDDCEDQLHRRHRAVRDAFEGTRLLSGMLRSFLSLFVSLSPSFPKSLFPLSNF